MERWSAKEVAVNNSPEAIREGVALLRQLFARHGLERMPADSFLEETVT